MQFVETAIAGAFIVEPDLREDGRGWFARTYCEDAFSAAGLNRVWPHCNASFNARKGTLRGLHWQADPHWEIKLVRCVRGACVDVAVDLRRDSPTYLKTALVELSEGTGRAFYIPTGCAHGFQTTRDNTELFYQMGSPFVAGSARGLHWLDPAFAIQWPDPDNAIVSDKDAQLPILESALC